MRDRSYFHSRGFSDETIDRELLGFDGDRYTIPVWRGVPQESACVQVARRKRPSTEGVKYLNIRGHGKTSLYGRWSLEGKELFVCFGLLTCLAMIQDGLPAASPSNGVVSWRPEFSAHFQRADKVYVIQDGTESERDPTHKVAASIGGHAKVVVTPWDYVDYADLRTGGRSAGEFLEYVRA